MGTVVDAISWIGFALVVTHIWMLGNKNPRDRIIGFCFGIISCFAWGWVGFMSENWAMLALQFVIGAVAFRGILNTWKLL